MKLPPLGLLGRTVLGLVAAGLAPLAIVPYLVHLNRAGFTDQVLRTHAVAARSTAARVRAFLSELRTPLAAAARNPQLYLDPHAPAAGELIAGLLQAQPLIVGVVVENAEGREVVRVQARRHAEAVEEVLSLPGLRSLRARRTASGSWLSLVLELPEGRGRLRAVAELEPLREILQTEELGREAVLVVASDEGVAAASEEGLELSSFPPALLELCRSGRVSGSSRQTGPNESLAACAPIEAGWFVLSQQPRRVAEELAELMQRRSLIAVAGALGIAALLSFASYRTVVRPLRDLVRAQQRMARVSKLTSGDEIQQLRAAFATLEQQSLDRVAMREIFLGRYLVEDLIGSGGMSSVFRGWDPKLQRAVALKTIRLEPAGAGHGADPRSSLLAEAVTIAKFAHPNIVAVHDVEDLGEAAFIAMELVDGMNLHALLADSKPLGVPRAALIGASVARGLAAAHAHGVVHRDVKPGNVLLGRDGSIKVVDFGVAGQVGGAASGEGLAFGTPGYVPPEALRGEGQSVAGDLFALGVLLYECLTGKNPFEGRDVQGTFELTLSSSPVPPRTRDATVPAELDDVVMGLIEKDPRWRRPASAEEAALRLEALVAAHNWRWLADLPFPQPASPTPPTRRRLTTVS